MEVTLLIAQRSGKWEEIDSREEDGGSVTIQDTGLRIGVGAAISEKTAFTISAAEVAEIMDFAPS